MAVLLTGCDNTSELQRRVAAAFSDPDAVQFKAFRVRKGIVCGALNAKNAFGAYTGYRPFVADMSDSGIVQPDFGPEDPVDDKKMQTNLETDREACRFAKAHPHDGYHGCELEPQDRLKNKVTNDFITSFRACEGSDGLAEFGT